MTVYSNISFLKALISVFISGPMSVHSAHFNVHFRTYERPDFDTIHAHSNGECRNFFHSIIIFRKDNMLTRIESEDDRRWSAARLTLIPPHTFYILRTRPNCIFTAYSCCPLVYYLRTIFFLFIHDRFHSSLPPHCIYLTAKTKMADLSARSMKKRSVPCTLTLSWITLHSKKGRVLTQGQQPGLSHSPL